MSIIMQTILKASFTAGIAALAVILLRITMKRLPKRWSYILWSVVFFRCLCPFSPEAAVSIFNIIPTESKTGQVSVAETVCDSPENYVTEYYHGNVMISSDDPIYKDYSGNAAFNRIAADAVSGTASEESPVSPGTVVFIIWATGVMVMVWYAVVSYTMLMQKVRAAVKMPDGVYETDMISTAFTAGFFAPKIYLPCGLSENDRRLIIAHEKVHIRRLDFIWKPLAFAGLALHWFNPLIWIAFIFMTRDMEFSCDEAVLETLGLEKKMAYSEALLQVSVKRSGLAIFPPAFAETGIKGRVKNVLAYKKPRIISTVIAAVIVVTTCVVLGTNAVENSDNVVKMLSDKESYKIKPEEQTGTKDSVIQTETYALQDSESQVIDVSDTKSKIENGLSTKATVYDKMLNTVDYFESADGTFVSNMIDMKSESTVEFFTDIPGKLSYEKMYDAVNDVETIYKGDYVSTYNNTAKTVLNLICAENEEDIEKLAGENRVSVEKDGNKCYYYRHNSTNLPYAKLVLLPQEMTFGLLSDFSLWSLNGNIEYLGRNCIVVMGTTSEEYRNKLNTTEFKMYIDENTGIILKYVGFDVNGELSGYIDMQNINIDSDVDDLYATNIAKFFNSDDYEEYMDIVKETLGERQKMIDQNMESKK